MALNLSPEDQAEYKKKSAWIEHKKQMALHYGNSIAAKAYRQEQTQLYLEYERKQLPPDPPTAWEREMAMTLEQRIDRIEQHLRIGRYKEE